MDNIRYYLDKYQEKLRCLLNDYGYGCTYVDDISCASGITYHRSEKYSSDVGILFRETDIDIVSSKLIEFINDVLENHIENGNKICFTILHGGKITGGFGVWVVKEKSEYLEKILNSEKAYLIGMLM